MTQSKKNDGKKGLGNESERNEDYSNIKIEELKLGVWTMKIASEPGFSLTKHWKDFKVAVPLFRRLVLDIFNVSPLLFTAYIICQIWQGIEDSMSLQLSNNLLRSIEEGITAGKPNTKEIATAVFLRFLCTQFIAYVSWYGDKMENQLETCVTRHFELILIQAKLEIDLPTSKAAANKQDISANEAWRALEGILRFYRTLLEAASMLFLVTHISRSTGGPLFALLCASQPLFAALMRREPWNKVSYGYIHDPIYQRMKSLWRLVYRENFQQDIISGGLGSWIGVEFRRSHQELGTVSDSHPFSQYYTLAETSASSMFVKFLGDLPMMFCAINSVLYPSRFSVSSIAILQQSSTLLRYSFIVAFRSGREYRESVAKIKKMYNATIVKNIMTVGDIPYPRTVLSEKPCENINPSKGMSFQLKNVAFSYAGSKKTTPALKSVSLTINPGQLVIIVGANGSGKSTLIRILSRLYDPASGEVLIDGLQSSDYRIEDLHQATALLSQDSNIYPLSLGENIGLGNPEYFADIEMITEAAKMGGALEFIGKLEKGMQTVLDPYVGVWGNNVYGNTDHPFHKEMEEIDKEIDISGGEKQRVVASRSFMRFKSGKVNFVAVDEPSSALDAEGELKLFENLLAVREGKTMVFVTHRFGHLTKHADLIICMKDGAIIETGTHTELMTKNGEYAGLYKIQASAFLCE